MDNNNDNNDNNRNDVPRCPNGYPICAVHPCF